MSGIVIYTILLGAVPLALITLIQYALERIIRLSREVPESQSEKSRPMLYILQFISDLIFFVIIPSAVYYWIYPILPFAGFRSGIALGVAAYILGSLPYAINLSLRIKIPATIILFTLFFNLLKVCGALAVITHYIVY